MEIWRKAITVMGMLSSCITSSKYDHSSVFQTKLGPTSFERPALYVFDPSTLHTILIRIGPPGSNHLLFSRESSGKALVGTAFTRITGAAPVPAEYLLSVGAASRSIRGGLLWREVDRLWVC